jgi:hypothetical protein
VVITSYLSVLGSSSSQWRNILVIIMFFLSCSVRVDGRLGFGSVFILEVGPDKC